MVSSMGGIQGLDWGSRAGFEKGDPQEHNSVKIYLF